MQRTTAAFRWTIPFAMCLTALGFILHPPLSVEGMAHDFWVPDHVLILVALVLMVPGYPALARTVENTTLATAGLGLVYLAMCSFMGVVYFELFVIPTLVVDAPHVLANGLLIGPLAAVLPLTGVTYVLGHWILGAAWWRAGMARLPVVLMMVGSVGVGMKPVLPTLVYSIGVVVFGVGLSILAQRLAAGRA